MQIRATTVRTLLDCMACKRFFRSFLALRGTQGFCAAAQAAFPDLSHEAQPKVYALSVESLQLTDLPEGVLQLIASLVSPSSMASLRSLCDCLRALLSDDRSIPWLTESRSHLCTTSILCALLVGCGGNSCSKSAQHGWHLVCILWKAMGANHGCN